MGLGALAFIIFFLAIGINAFLPHRFLVIAYGIAAILIGVVALVTGTSMVY